MVVSIMKNPDQLWMDIADRFGEQSKCKSRQVGAILVLEGRLFSQGWNGAPRGSTTESCLRCSSCHHQSGKDLDKALCSHAEANAIANAARAGRSTIGSTIYCTTYPCAECAKLIVGAGIVEVVYEEQYDSPLSRIIFENAQLKVRQFNVRS